jgi:hypothetical protein
VRTLWKGTWGVNEGKACERGAPHTLKPKLQRSLLGKTSIPLGGHNVLLRRSGKGLDKVEKGWEGHVMLRGSLSNHHFTFSHPLTHYYNFYILPCLDFNN